MALGPEALKLEGIPSRQERAHARAVGKFAAGSSNGGSRKHLPRSQLGKTTAFAVGEWETLLVLLRDGRLEIDCYFLIVGTESGSIVTLISTLIGTCRACGFDPKIYFDQILKSMSANVASEEAEALTAADELRPATGVDAAWSKPPE